MKVIRSRLGDNVHLRPKREAAFGAVAVIGEVDLLDAIEACPRHARSFLAFGLEKTVHVAAVG